MNRKKLRLAMRKITPADAREIERRERKYRHKLERQGYRTYGLVDESGCFGIVLVEHLASGRRGLLQHDGQIRWMDQPMGPGALAAAAVSGVTIDRGR